MLFSGGLASEVMCGPEMLGCGVFFSVGDDRNRSFTLPGREQTNNRAVLLAAITAMRVQDGNWR